MLKSRFQCFAHAHVLQIGLVVYVGTDTKIMMNRTIHPRKVCYSLQSSAIHQTIIPSQQSIKMLENAEAG